MFVTVTQVNHRDDEMRFVIVKSAAKNYTSVRRIEVTPATAALLRRRLGGRIGPDSHAVPLAPEDLVFTNSHGRRWYQQNFLTRTWTAMLEAAELPTEGEGRKTPHALRHTHIAILDRAGATLPQMSRRAGHSDIRTTVNGYGGQIDQIGADVLTGVDELALPMATPAAGAVVSGDVVELAAISVTKTS